MALAECGSHAVVGAALGTAGTGERTLAADLVPMVGPRMLVIADAGLFSWELFNTFTDTGADLVWRIGASVSVRHLRWLAEGSYLALIFRSELSAARRALRRLNPKRRHRTCPACSSEPDTTPTGVKRPSDKIIRRAGPPTPLLARPNDLP